MRVLDGFPDFQKDLQSRLVVFLVLHKRDRHALRRISVLGVQLQRLLEELNSPCVRGAALVLVLFRIAAHFPCLGEVHVAHADQSIPIVLVVVL